MRRTFILLLLASAAAPTTARPQDKDDDRPSRIDIRPSARAERSGSPARDDRSERIERPERSAPLPRFERPERVDRPQRTEALTEQVRAWSRPERSERPQIRVGSDRPEPPSPPQGADRPAPQADRANDNDAGSATSSPPQRRADGPRTPGGNRTGRGWTQQPRDGDIADRRFRRALDRRFGDRHGRMNEDRPYDGVWNERVRELAVSTVPMAGTQPPLRIGRERRNWSTEWSRDWRDDRRYDWRGHRNRNRSIFHIGFYYDPFGWDYLRYNIGWRMWPNYYGRNYWLHDPWMYRLPPAYPGTQWIRYHHDAILIDTWTGEVVDVIYDFFW